MPPLSRASPRRIYLVLAAGVAVLWLGTLSVRPLFNPDEGRYAEIPREMLQGGDWVIPHLDGLAYVEKPPLQYWATAFFLGVLGENELGARFYTGLCALACVLVAASAARRIFGREAGLTTAAMLAGMPLFVVMGQLLTLDMSLTLYMTSALAGFLLAQSGPPRPWMLLAWVATAFGVLTKGPVAAFIPAASLLLYSLYRRDVGPWRRLDARIGLALFMMITVPWYALAARRLPDFLPFFFVHEHLARYLTTSAHREEPGWFFGPVLVLGSLPWTLAALRGLSRGWSAGWGAGRRRAGQGGEEGCAPAAFDAALFLRIYVLTVCVFFSLSSSKLIPYILPALPALALLAASNPTETLERDLAAAAFLTLGAAIALGLACLLAPAHLTPSDRSAYFLSLAKPVAQAAILLAASGLYALVLRRRDLTRSAVFLGVGWTLSGLLLVRAAAAVAPVYSGIELARALPAAPAEAIIYSVGTYDQTLPFYWRRTLELVAYRGELDYGLRYHPLTEIASIEEFVQRWSASRESAAYAVMTKALFVDLTGRGVPMRELARDVNRVLVARR